MGISKGIRGRRKGLFFAPKQNNYKINTNYKFEFHFNVELISISGL